MRLIKLILILCFMVIASAFAYMNAKPVALDYYLGVIEVPLAVTLIAAVIVGAVLGVVVCMGAMVRQRFEISELSRKLHLAQGEVENLRSLPIKE